MKKKVIKTYLILPGKKEELIEAQDPRVLRIYQAGKDFYADVCETCRDCCPESRCP